jgi:hypothetical protein
MRSAASVTEGVQELLRRLPQGLRRRHLLLPCILLVQLLLLALVSLNPALAPARAVPAAPISLFDVRTPAATPEPPKAKPKPVEVTALPKIQLKVETALPAPPSSTPRRPRVPASAPLATSRRRSRVPSASMNR